MKQAIIKGILMLATVAVLTVACSSESYPGLTYDSVSSPENAEGEDAANKVPIFVYVNRQSVFSVTSGSETRGIGYFDALNSDEELPDDEQSEYKRALYENTLFNVFAFRRDVVNSDYAGTLYPSELSKDPDMGNTYKAENSTRSKDDNQYDCLVDGYDYYRGMNAHLDDKTGFIFDVAVDAEGKQDQLYYSQYQDVGYDFFAYAIDDFKADASNTHREQNRVYYDLELDGTQDVMCGYAPALTDDLLKTQYPALKLTDDERTRLLWIGGYSTYAAHRNVDPYIHLKHQLARLHFRVYPGERYANDGTNFITIDEVRVVAPNKGTLTVAVRNPESDDPTHPKVGFEVDESSEYTYLLHEAPELDENKKPKSAELIESGYYKTPEWKDEYKKVPVGQRPYTAIGGRYTPLEDMDDNKVTGSIMIPESKEILVTIKATQHNVEDIEDKTIYSTYRVKPSDKIPDNMVGDEYHFRAGKYYTIGIAVYGLQKIRVNAHIDNWEDGGGVDLDPEDIEYETVDNE